METIFFGNGINRLIDGFPSWNTLLKKIAGKNELHPIPNNLLQYEDIISNMYDELPQSYEKLKDKDVEAYDKKLEEKVKEKTRDVFVANGLPIICLDNPIFKILFEKKANHYITTNYDNYLLEVFENKGYTASIEEKRKCEKIYNIRRNYSLAKEGEDTIYYWPIHGEIRAPKSIMLGLDHYCGSIAKMDRYLKEDDLRSGDGVEKMGFLRRLRSLQEQENFEIKSWIDLFFLSDIHIIGFSFGYEEIDLWWILNRRKRTFMLDNSLVKNKIVFYGTPSYEGQADLFKDFGVEVRYFDYREIYTKQLDGILQRENIRENVDSKHYDILKAYFGDKPFYFKEMPEVLRLSRIGCSRVLKKLIDEGKCEAIGKSLPRMKYRLE